MHTPKMGSTGSSASGATTFVGSTLLTDTDAYDDGMGMKLAPWKSP